MIFFSESSEAIGSLLSTENDDPKIRIIKAIKASAANDIYVDYPIVLTDIETTRFDVITEDLDPLSNRILGNNNDSNNQLP